MVTNLLAGLSNWRFECFLDSKITSIFLRGRECCGGNHGSGSCARSRGRGIGIFLTAFSCFSFNGVGWVG
jgi:hypothetical protein